MKIISTGRRMVSPSGQLGNEISSYFTGCSQHKYMAEFIRDMAGGSWFYRLWFWEGNWWVFPKQWKVRQFTKYIRLTRELEQKWTREKYEELEAFKKTLSTEEEK